MRLVDPICYISDIPGEKGTKKLLIQGQICSTRPGRSLRIPPGKLWIPVPATTRPVLRIFISSTAIDLTGYRDKVRDAVLRSVTQPVEQIELLGYQGKMRWMQNETGLRVPMPSMQPSRHAVTLKINFL